ncbi:MAG: hypothetical protein ACD_50C00319G0005 [uncultured bacterium]|nr:MAG: hypothetical protein ACD_50C00319G0005 [uncultured bacterium]
MKPFLVFSQMLQPDVSVVGEKTKEVGSSASGETDDLARIALLDKTQYFGNLVFASIGRV